jgi:hypothetical protein
MKLEAVDLPIHSETLWAVVLGAVLATLSGLVATQFEAHLRRRERERDAALLFGEILYTLKILIGRADEARGRGDPYGPITIRLLNAVRRELDIYDRNREALYDLRDGDLRLRLHTLVVRLGLGIESVRDPHEALQSLTGSPREGSAGDLAAAREGGFAFLMECAAEIGDVLQALARPAGRGFGARPD